MAQAESEISDNALKIVSVDTATGERNLATRIDVIADPVGAWNHIRNRSSSNDFICVTGSAFLIAELRKYILPH